MTDNAVTIAADERTYTYALTGPEIELAELVRLAHSQNFRTTVEHRDGTFIIRVTDLDARKTLQGSGATFESAWRSMPGAELVELGLHERIMARGTMPDINLTLVPRS